MALNASIITDTAKEITKRTVVDYGAGVFAHTTQDWARHNVVRVYPDTPFTAGGGVVATQSLRLVATRDDGTTFGQDLALIIPINSAGTNAITNSVPIIIQQPVSRSAPEGANVQILVAAISDIPLTYQWYKKNSLAVFVAIAGKTATTLVLPAVTTADSGDYRVVVTNANGSVTSSTMTLSVVAPSGGDEDDPWYESLPGIHIFDFF